MLLTCRDLPENYSLPLQGRHAGKMSRTFIRPTFNVIPSPTATDNVGRSTFTAASRMASVTGSLHEGAAPLETNVVTFGTADLRAWPLQRRRINLIGTNTSGSTQRPFCKAGRV